MAQSQSADEIRAFVARAVDERLPLEEVQLTYGDKAVTVYVSCPPYSVIERSLIEPAKGGDPDLYAAFLRNHVIYATFDRATKAGEMLFVGDEGRRAQDYMITSDNENWRKIRDAADRFMGPLLKTLAGKAETEDSGTATSAPAPANDMATLGSGASDLTPTSNTRSVGPSSEDSSESLESAVA